MAIMSIVFVNYQMDDAPWYFYPIFLVGCFLQSWLSTHFFMRKMRAIQKVLLEEHVDLGSRILSKGAVNRLRGIYATGGMGYLLDDKLVFIPHRVNLSKNNLTILYSDIAQISGYRILGFMNTGLKIMLKSGETEKFVIDKTDVFYQHIINIQ
jgi:hypothetical protein